MGAAKRVRFTNDPSRGFLSAALYTPSASHGHVGAIGRGMGKPPPLSEARLSPVVLGDEADPAAAASGGRRQPTAKAARSHAQRARIVCAVSSTVVGGALLRAGRREVRESHVGGLASTGNNNKLVSLSVQGSTMLSIQKDM
jgi:hypothetical protein